MKTAISIPDEIFEAAELAAKRLGISRSQLYAKAVAEYLAQNGAENVTEVLDEVYADRRSELDPLLLHLQLASVAEEDW